MIETKTIELGSKVAIHVRLSLDNGFVIEDTFDNEPLSFTIGDGSLEAGLENSLLGLAEDDHKIFHFEAGEVFPPHDDSNVKQLPISDFAGFEPGVLQKGLILGFETPSGEQAPGMILEFNEDTVTVDFNHPLSGKPFTFEVEVISIS